MYRNSQDNSKYTNAVMVYGSNGAIRKPVYAPKVSWLRRFLNWWLA